MLKTLTLRPNDFWVAPYIRALLPAGAVLNQHGQDKILLATIPLTRFIQVLSRAYIRPACYHRCRPFHIPLTPDRLMSESRPSHVPPGFTTSRRTSELSLSHHFVYLEKLYSQTVYPRSRRACSSPVLSHALLGFRNEADGSHRGPGSSQILCTRIVTRTTQPSLSSYRNSKCSSFSFRRTILLSVMQNLDTTLVHRAGHSSFSSRHLCQSSDNSFHTWSSKEFLEFPFSRPHGGEHAGTLWRFHLFHGDPFGHKVQYAFHLRLENRAVTIIDILLRPASRVFSSWSTRSIQFVLFRSKFH